MVILTAEMVPPDIASFMRALERAPKIAEQVIGANIAYPVLLSLRDATPVDTGFLKDSWDIGGVDGGVSIYNHAPYAHILEEGLYQSSSPSSGKTVSWGGGIYSSQAVGGMITPFMEKDANIEEMADRVMSGIEQEIERA